MSCVVGVICLGIGAVGTLTSFHILLLRSCSLRCVVEGPKAPCCFKDKGDELIFSYVQFPVFSRLSHFPLFC